jgi:hypothetical protein
MRPSVSASRPACAACPAMDRRADAARVTTVRHGLGGSSPSARGYLRRGPASDFCGATTYRDLCGHADPGCRMPGPSKVRPRGGPSRHSSCPGGNQTTSLTFPPPPGRQSDYVFRMVDKDRVTVPDGFKGSIVENPSRSHQVQARIFPAAGRGDGRRAHGRHPRPAMSIRCSRSWPDEPRCWASSGEDFLRPHRHDRGLSHQAR